MNAKVTKPFRGAPDGLIHAKEFAIGDEVTGDLAAVAVTEGWAEEVKAEPEEGKGKSTKAKAAKSAED